MKKYEIVFRVDTSGFCEEEVSEKVGELFDGSRMAAGDVLAFMWTRQKKGRGLMFESVVNVTTAGVDELDASEKAGSIIDPRKLEPSMGVSLEGVRRIKSGMKEKMGGLIYKREKVLA